MTESRAIFIFETVDSVRIRAGSTLGAQINAVRPQQAEISSRGRFLCLLFSLVRNGISDNV